MESSHSDSLPQILFECTECTNSNVEPEYFTKEVITDTINNDTDRQAINHHLNTTRYDKYGNKIQTPFTRIIEYCYVCSNGHKLPTQTEVINGFR